MPATDYYKTLGVSRSASSDEIRKAYKKLARENHPDAHPDDKTADAKFKAVQEAYAVLNDAQKRQMYDQYGAAFGEAGRGRGQQAWSAGPGGAMDIDQIFGGQVDLGDLFGDAFGGGMFGGGRGGGRRPRQPQKGQNVQAGIQVPFQVAAAGGAHDLQMQRDGKTERLTVKIPAGVSGGSVIRLTGQGHPGQNGGPPGDLLVTVQVSPHPYFRRDGNQLLLEVPITIAEATLGTKIEVPTLSEGTVMLTIPPSTSSGTRLRLRGKGVPDQKTKVRGDQLVSVKIVVPEALNERARELIEELAQAVPQSPRENLW